MSKTVSDLTLDVLNEFKQDQERKVRYEIQSILTSILKEQNFIADAQKRIKDLQKQLKEVKIEEIKIELE